MSRKSHNEASNGKAPIGSTQAIRTCTREDATCFPGPLAEVNIHGYVVMAHL